MKKLFLITALMLTGFAFYSCDDVVDNPAQDPTQAWNYSVSVKFADFDFTAQPTDPVTGEPNTYVAPKTLYVLNEQNTLMGTITTDVAPAAGDYATYAGKITGSIGNNLIITTKIGNDLGKQDGTLASAIKNGIVQTAEVPIKIYNANSGTLTTASAKLENKTAIAHTAIWQVKGGDKIAVVADDQAFEWTVSKEFDPSKSEDLYIAIPTNTNPEAEYTISTEAKDGYNRGAAFKLADWPTIATSKVSPWLGYLPLIETGVDLTKWDAYQRETYKATGTLYFNQWINDDKTFIITQSGEKAIDANVVARGNGGKNVAVILNNIRLEKNCYFEVWDGATFDITLIGENEFESLYLESPYIKKGDGTWKFNKLIIRGGTYWNGTEDVSYAAEHIINENLNLTYLEVSSGGKLTIADDKKVNVNNENAYEYAIYTNGGELTIGEKAEVNAIAAKNISAFYTKNTTITIKDNAKVLAKTTGTGGSGFDFNGNDKKLTIGKNVTITAIGTPDNWSQIGHGMIINTTGEVTIGDGTKITAESENGYYGLYLGNATITLGEGTAITATLTGEDNLYWTEAALYTDNVTIKGKGTITAESKCGYPGLRVDNTLTLNGGVLEAIGGPDKVGARVYGTLVFGDDFNQFKVKTGQTGASPIYILNSATDAELVIDETKLIETKKDGYRTITPKSAK